MTETETDRKPGPVAVIAVHGVADQKKDAVAGQTVDLLLQMDALPPEEGETFNSKGYEGFQAETIRVPVDPLDVSSMPESDAWHYQLKEHLKDYRGEGRKEVYESVRIEGDRVTRRSRYGAAKPERKVHVYEMHWADISRLQFGIFNVFAAIYRLLFETSWLGKQTIGKWAAFGEDVGKYSTITSLRGIMLLLHSTAMVIMSRFMPVMYLLMIFMLMLTAVPVIESSWAAGFFRGVGEYRGLFTVSVMAGVGGILIGIAYRFWRSIPWQFFYVIIVGVSVLIGNVLLVLLQGKSTGWWPESGLAVMTWLGICLAMHWLVLPILNRAFPGTQVVGDLLMVIFTIGLILGLCHRSDWPLMISGPLKALRFASAMMPFAWIILSSAANIFLILALFELLILRFRLDLPKEVVQRRRSRLRTAVVSIALPVLLVSFLNGAFFQLTLVPSRLGGLDGVRALPNRSADAPAVIDKVEAFLHQYVDPVSGRWASFPDFEAWSDKNVGPEVKFSSFASFASDEMLLPFLEFIFLIILLVMGYSLWIVAPAVWAERSREVEPGQRQEITVALGNNLSRGYKWIWFGQVVLAGCMLVTQGFFTYRAIRTAKIKADPAYGQNDSPAQLLLDQFVGIRPVESVPIAAAAAARPIPAGPGAAARPADRSQFDRLFDEKKARIRRSIEKMWQQSKQGDDMEQRRARPPSGARPGPGSAPLAQASPPPAAGPDRKPLLYLILTEAVVFLNTGPLTSAVGFFILLLGLGYVFLSRLIDPLVAGLRGGLDMALDVVNYLHPFPKNRTARARILNRYASLLQYITEWRDPQNPEIGYSRIVIIAHSQGGVITSDILRALNAGTVARDNRLGALASPPGTVAPIPIRVLTMGSPQIQLYEARFADLYAWDHQADPRLNHRALECWWNIYRSGDYVGRMIFRDLRDPTVFQPDQDFVMERDGKRLPIRETCIGPGAHTHYWGKNAPESVIRKLDTLISCDQAEALACADRPPREENRKI